MALITVSNNSLTAVTALPASIPTGALTLIKSITASSSASISFVHGADGVILDTTYKSYIFKFINCHPETNNVFFTFQGTIADESASYNQTITSTHFRAYHNEADSATILGSVPDLDQAQGTDFQKLGYNVGNLADESLSGTLQIFNPSSTTFVKHFIARCNIYYEGNFSFDSFTAGYFNQTAALRRFQFKMSSGAIDDGIIKLYGVK